MYSKRRIDMLHELRWAQGTLPDHVKANLTPQELEFSRAYSRLLGGYMRSEELGGVGLDLTAVRSLMTFQLTPLLCLLALANCTVVVYKPEPDVILLFFHLLSL